MIANTTISKTSFCCFFSIFVLARRQACIIFAICNIYNWCATMLWGRLCCYLFSCMHQLRVNQYLQINYEEKVWWWILPAAERRTSMKMARPGSSSFFFFFFFCVFACVNRWLRKNMQYSWIYKWLSGRVGENMEILTLFDFIFFLIGKKGCI